MEAKKPSSKKVFDITSPKKASSSSRPLVVTNRPVMKQDPMMSSALPDKDDNKITVSTTAPTLLPTKHVTITPPSEDTKEPEEPKAPEEPAISEKPAVAEETTKEDDEKPAEEAKKDPEPKIDEAPANHTKEVDEVSTIDDSALEEKPADDETSEENQESEGDEEPAKPDVEDQKIAEANAARKAELEGVIESRQYFVPINAVERKRSLKITVTLMLLVIILGVVLVDVMLDAGVIHITQNIPHSHFFDVNK